MYIYVHSYTHTFIHTHMHMDVLTMEQRKLTRVKRGSSLCQIQTYIYTYIHMHTLTVKSENQRERGEGLLSTGQVRDILPWFLGGPHAVGIYGIYVLLYIYVCTCMHVYMYTYMCRVVLLWLVGQPHAVGICDICVLMYITYTCASAYTVRGISFLGPRAAGMCDFICKYANVWARDKKACL